MPTLDENMQITQHDLILEDGSGKEVARLAATLFVGASGADPGTACRIVIRDDAGVTRIDLDGSDPDIKLMGADLAEDFDGPAALAPGTVVVAVGPEEVAPADAALHRRVVGVTSGAGDFQPAHQTATR